MRCGERDLFWVFFLPLFSSQPASPLSPAPERGTVKRCRVSLSVSDPLRPSSAATALTLSSSSPSGHLKQRFSTGGPGP